MGAGLGSRWAIRKTFSDLYNDAKIYADDIKKAKIEFRKLYDYKQKLHEAQKAGKQGKVWRTDKKGNPIHYRQAFREARDNLKTVMRLKNGKWYWKKLARGGLNLIPWTIGGLTTLSGIGDGISAYSKWQEDGSMPFNISRHFIKPYNDIQLKNLEQNLELMEKNFNPNR